MLILGTNEDYPANTLVKAYRRRMAIEEMFRDEKNIRYGWGLRFVSLSTPERMECLILVLAIAYFLLILSGFFCHDKFDSSHWASSRRAGRTEVSAFYVGRIMLERLFCPIRHLFRLLKGILRQDMEENRG